MTTYVDYKQTMEQSLEYFQGNKIAAKVFVDKYALRDGQGRFLEATPRDMHKRLAREFARIESKYPNPLSEEEIFGYLDEFRYIIPQGSPMAGIGNPFQVMSISNCVHGESLVYTKEHGLVKMRDIVPGLHVLTHKGRFRKVLRHWSNGKKETYTIARSFSGKQVSVRTEQEMGRFCAVTPDHRVYTDSGEWQTVESLIGKHNKALSTPSIAAPNTQGADLSVIPMGLGRTVLMDETLAWIFGLYFAEGAIKHQDALSPSTYFTLAKEEVELAERISAWSESNLGHKAWIQTWEGLNFIQVNVFDKFFSRFILDNFGHGFNKKRIPEWVFALPETVRAAFLDGFMTGDATNYEGLDVEYNVFSIANPTLAYELGLLARSLGKKVRFNFQATGKLIKHRTVTVSMSTASEVIKLVKSPVMAEVFDMEVDEDHSFVAGDIICHNCFVIQSPYDSYGGILKADQEQAQIMKRRGGVGFDISTIRPRGLPTANAAQTTDGIGVFMERFSNTCREVAQGGRRGALMLTLSVHHPEIRTFIHIKEDLKKVTGANISIRLSDEFMTAVKNKEKVQLRFPVDSREPTISEMVDAEELWTEIIAAAHKSAEPGLLFWDTVMRECPTTSYPEFITISTNPCQPGWATVLTPEGIRTFNDISVGSIIWSGKRWTKVVNKVCTGVKPVYGYKTRAGTFYGTENHRVVSGGEKIEVALADSIDTSQGQLNSEDARKPLDPHDIIDGLVWGDGEFHKASNKVFLHIGQDDQCYFDSEIKHLILEHRPGVKQTAYAVRTTNEVLKKTYERELHPDWLYSADQQKIRGFLRGLFTANGTVVGNRVQLKSSCLKLIEQVQLMLSMLGISSYYTTNKAHEVEFENGTYECKESYDLGIGTKQGRQLFQQLIGFIHPEKQKKLQVSLDLKPSSKSPKVSYEIVDTQYLGEEKVYDITVEADEHTYWTGGLLVSNCGEITLSAYDSCRLLLVNALSFVRNPFLNPTMDWLKFQEVVFVAQRLMDDIVDLELECIDKIIQKIKDDPEPEEVKLIELNLWNKIRSACFNGRRTGLGLTGVGDLVAAMNMRYGSPESIEFVERLYKELAATSYSSSIAMAKERGPFPAFSYELESSNPFIQRTMAEMPQIASDYKHYGRRNIANLTTPPAGSTSMLAKSIIGYGVSSGIENVIYIRSIRRKKINPNDKDARVDFVDEMGDKWTEFPVYHNGFEAWKQITGKTDDQIKESPYWNSTADDVDWVAKVDMQGAAQKWIDHSISNTTNLPEEADVETVKQVYMRGWEKGCKGITIYRKNSRAGVILDDSAKKKEAKKAEFNENHAPKRPHELDCDVYHSTIQGEKWTIFVGKLDGRPYELMGGLAKFVNMPRRVKNGKTLKHNGEINPARYDFHYDYDKGPEDETVIRDIGNVFENPVHSAFTRSISLNLRHGVPVQYVCEQLLKGSEKESDLYSFSRVMSRVLKNYILDGTKTTQKRCPDCKSSNLSYQQGCVTCLDCGSSKCG
jgi:ribonucleotide reductase alpha subunit